MLGRARYSAKLLDPHGSKSDAFTFHDRSGTGRISVALSLTPIVRQPSAAI